MNTPTGLPYPWLGGQPKFRLLVCGGRTFSERGLICAVLDPYIEQIALLIHGGAHGADSLAGEWARAHGIPERVFPADWNKYGGAAGPIRNQEMITIGKPNYAVAFPGGTGTRDMVTRLKAHSIPVIEVTIHPVHMAWCKNPRLTADPAPCSSFYCPHKPYPKSAADGPPRAARPLELTHCGLFQMTETSNQWSTARHVAPPNTVTTDYDPD